MSVPKDEKKKSFIIKVKAGDLVDLLKKSNEEEEDILRFVHIFSDYDPDYDLIIQISDKTDQ